MIENLWIRGDTHGSYKDWLSDFCGENNTCAVQDAIIILGDNAIRFEGEQKIRETIRKNIINNYDVTIFAVRGNHDRPYNVGNDLKLCSCPYVDNNNPYFWHDDEVPNVWYFQDGEEYTIAEKTFLVIGGAYSIDKYYRQMMNWTWYEGEELSEEELRTIYNKVRGKTYDYVLTHTCPKDIIPTWLFLKGVDQSKVSYRMENWFQKIANEIQFKTWYFGHYHDDYKYPEHKYVMLYNKIEKIV